MVEYKMLPVRLPVGLVEQLDEIASARHRSRTYVIEQMIRSKVDEMYPKLEELKRNEKEVW